MRDRRLVGWLFFLLLLIVAFWVVTLVWSKGKNIIPSADTAGWLAYVTDKEGPTHIWFVDAAGKQFRAEPSSQANDAEPCWQQPDGRTLFFTSDRNERVEQLFHLSPANQNVNQLTLGGARKSDLHSSKSGEQVLYIAGGLVSVFTLGHNEPEQLIPPPQSDPGENKALMERWQSEFGSSSFKSVTWGKSSSNMLVGVIGGDEGDALVVQQFDVRQRKQQEPQVRLVAKRIDVAYHPSEDLVAVALWQQQPVRHAEEDRSWYGSAPTRTEKHPSGLVIVDVATGATTPVFISDKVDTVLISPSWSPDGKQIAVIRAAVENGELVSNGVIIMPATEAGARTSTVIDTGECGDPQWSPDGKKLAYTKGPMGDRDIYVFDTDSGKSTQLTTTGDDFSPRWSPRIKEAQQ